MNRTETGVATNSLMRNHRYYFGSNPVYELRPTEEPNSPCWWIWRNGLKYRDFTSLAAARGWLEHVLKNPEQTL